LQLHRVEADCEICGPAPKSPVISARDYETECPDVFDVVRCGSCGLVFTSPRVSQEDLFQHFYGDQYVCYVAEGLANKCRERYLGRSRLRNIRHLMPTGGRFLDVGCSYGYFLEYLKTHTDWDVYGCEPQRDAAEMARGRGLEVSATVLTDAEYESGYFDCVYMSHVLEHVPNVVETVREVARILKPGGVFITENPDMDSPARRLFGVCWWGYHLPRHLTHFTGPTLTRILSMAGLKVERVTPCFRPGPIAWSVQNCLKHVHAPGLFPRLFGMYNPVFVAVMGFPALVFMGYGHSDMMETVARKE
jgi:SAM-dependent methyltransferase